MIRTDIHLLCDHCGAPFPEFCGLPVVRDGAIYTPAMIRREAKDAGWVRRQFFWGKGYINRDLCRKCKYKPQGSVK